MTRDPKTAKRYHKCPRCGLYMGCGRPSGLHSCSKRYGGCGYKHKKFEVGLVTPKIRPLLAKFTGKVRKNKEAISTRELSIAIRNGKIPKGLTVTEAVQ